jgi:L-iditol 2-dehydrogenase
MRAAVLEAPQRLTVQSLPDPAPGRDEVLVRVQLCGVCGTDRAIYRDEYPVQHPITLGHEYAGSVESLGPGVTDLAVGDFVAVDPNVVDDVCYFCRHGVDHLCSGLRPLGVAQPGGFAELSVVPARYAYRLPEGMRSELGAQVEPVACCVHGIDRAQITAGDFVAVIGCGPIGCILIQLARLQGAAMILGVEPNPARRKLALSAGADAVCEPGSEGAEASRQRPSALPDVVIEASGNPVAAAGAFSLVRRGGTVLLFGVYPEGARIEISPFRINEDELRVVGSLNNPHTHQRAIDLLSSGRLDLTDLITDVLGLSELERTMDVSNFPNAGKILIQPEL